jgi:hypothetical protein
VLVSTENPRVSVRAQALVTVTRPGPGVLERIVRFPRGATDFTDAGTGGE